MPLDPDLGGKLIHVRPGFGSLRAQGVDVDGLHGAVQLSDLLLQGHCLDKLLGSLARRQGCVLPGECGFRQGRSPSVGIAVLAQYRERSRRSLLWLLGRPDKLTVDSESSCRKRRHDQLR
jgi:hypothetical protein